jgi:hypothetical protein
LDIKSSRRFFGCGTDFKVIPRAQQFVAQCYGKVDLDCQAMSGAGQPNGAAFPLDRIPADPPSARDLHENAQILTRPRKRTANRRRIVRI